MVQPLIFLKISSTKIIPPCASYHAPGGFFAVPLPPPLKHPQNVTGLSAVRITRQRDVSKILVTFFYL